MIFMLLCPLNVFSNSCPEYNFHMPNDLSKCLHTFRCIHIIKPPNPNRYF